MAKASARRIKRRQDRDRLVAAAETLKSLDPLQENMQAADRALKQAEIKMNLLLRAKEVIEGSDRFGPAMKVTMFGGEASPHGEEFVKAVACVEAQIPSARLDFALAVLDLIDAVEEFEAGPPLVQPVTLEVPNG